MPRPLSAPTALGVDFGTSHTIAVVRRADGSVRPLLFDGAPLMPSAVCASPDGGLLVGGDAVHAGRRHPERFEPNPKRLLDRESILLGDHEFPVTDLVAAVLGAVAEECRRVVGAPRQVTITFPADWGPSRRRVVEDAAVRAGLGQVRLVPEPVAAATYYAETLKHHMAVGSSIVVYDLGAGTFDASVVRRTDHGFESVALDGRDDLGGLDIDAAIVGHLAETYGGREGWQRLTDPSTVEERRAFRELQQEIRGAKERLSRHMQVDFTIPLLDTESHLTRGELEQIAAPHLDRTIEVTRAVISAAGLDLAQSAGVFLVGGASRMPLVATMLHRALGVAPTVLDQPEVVVAEGSVLWAETAPTSSPPPVYTPQLAPSLPVGTPQRDLPTLMPRQPIMPLTPQRSPSPQRPYASPATSEATLPAPTPPQPPMDEAERQRRKRRARKIVLAVVVVDVLIIAALLIVLNPGGADDPGGGSDDTSGDISLTEAIEALDGIEQFGPTDAVELHDGAITAIATVETDSGPALFTAGADKVIRQWDLKTGDAVGEEKLEYAVNGLTPIEFSGGATKMLAIDSHLGLHTWAPGSSDPETLAEPTPKYEEGSVQRIAAGVYDGHAALAFMTADAYVVVDLETEEQLGPEVPFTEQQRNGYSNFAVFEDTINVVNVSAEGTIGLYDAVTGEEVAQVVDTASGWDDGDAPESLTMLDNGRWPIATVLSDGTYFTWDLVDRFSLGAKSWEIDPGARIHRDLMTVGRNGDSSDEDGYAAGTAALIAYGGDGGAEVIEFSSGDHLSSLDDPDSESNGLTAVATGDYYSAATVALTGYADGTLRLWNLGN